MLSECIYKVLMASGVVTSSDACDLSGAIEAAVLEVQLAEAEERSIWIARKGGISAEGKNVSKEGDPYSTQRQSCSLTW